MWLPIDVCVSKISVSSAVSKYTHTRRLEIFSNYDWVANNIFNQIEAGERCDESKESDVINEKEKNPRPTPKTQTFKMKLFQIHTF